MYNIGAAVGLKNVYIAIITEDNDGYETYGTPEYFAPVMNVSMNIDFAEGKLSADDITYAQDKIFNGGTITAGFANIKATMLAKVLGAKIDDNGIVVHSAEDYKNAPFVAFGFEAPHSTGKSRFEWFYRVKFSTPNESYQTKGDSVNYSTPSLEGKIFAKNKPISNGDHPWHAVCLEGESESSAATIAAWFNAVPEPSFTP